MATRNPKDDLMELALREGAKHVVKWFKEAKAVVEEAQQEVKVAPVAKHPSGPVACQCSHHDDGEPFGVPIVTDTIRKWLFALVSEKDGPFSPTVVSHDKVVGNNSEVDLQRIRVKAGDRDVYVYVSSYEL